MDFGDAAWRRPVRPGKFVRGIGQEIVNPGYSRNELAESRIFD